METHRVCDNCEKIHDWWNDDGYTCEGCNGEYCIECCDNDHVDIFTFEGKKWCTLCFQTEPDDPDDSLLLNYLLKKQKISRDRLLQDFRKTAVAPHAYVCTECPENTCPSAMCESIPKTFYHEERDDYCRGFCCGAQNLAEICSGCKKWASRICIPMLGIRKRRRGNLLNDVPRDILIQCILIPYIIKPLRGRPPKIRK